MRRLLPIAALLFVLQDGAWAVHRLVVPFFPDKTDQCGPATLAGVLSYWGKKTEPQELKKEMYVAKLKGTLPMDLIAAAQARGLEIKMVTGTVDQIRQELREGRPVLAMLNMGYAIAPVDHYVIITGYDDERGGFFLHSGGKADQFMAYQKFQKKWQKADSWAMLARLP